MKILIVAATYTEIAPLLSEVKCKKKHNPFFSSHTHGKNDIDFLITGVGMTSTAFLLGKALSEKKYDAALNVGIAGSFKKKIKTGAVLNVDSEIISELGAENRNSFLKFNELKLSKSTLERSAYCIENKFKIKIPEISRLPSVKGITVNTVHGNSNTIVNIKKRFAPDVETMEGAAFLYACNMEKIKCAQIRAISNYVEERTAEHWNAALAIKNLNETVFRIIDSL